MKEVELNNKCEKKTFMKPNGPYKKTRDLKSEKETPVNKEELIKMEKTVNTLQFRIEAKANLKRYHT